LTSYKIKQEARVDELNRPKPSKQGELRPPVFLYLLLNIILIIRQYRFHAFDAMIMV
jgi:hypothetical protein